MVIDNKFDIGDIVYIKTDVEQLPCMVTSFEVTSKDVLYQVSMGGSVRVFYDFQLTLEKQFDIHL